jgi:CheY-like chemotaxis protein
MLQNELIDCVVDVFRILSGAARVTPTSVSVKEVAAEVVSNLQPVAAERGVEIELTSEDIAMGATDAERLRRIVSCLLRHQLKVAAQGCSIVVDLNRDATHVRVRVGTMVDGEAPTSVVDEDDAIGADLYLALARALVEPLDGRVVRRRQPRGAVDDLAVEIPLPVSPFVGPAGEARRRATVSLVGSTILVVDDAPDIRTLTATILRMRNAEVHLAGSAAEAMRVLDRLPIDVMVSDIAMPSEDGASLVRRAKRRFPKLVAVALSAASVPEAKRVAIEAGFSRFLAKPVDPDRLVETVASLLVARG